MAQTFAVAQYVAPVNDDNGSSAYNNCRVYEADTVVPTASAHLLPSFGESPSPASFRTAQAVATTAVATTAVATPYNAPENPTTHTESVTATAAPIVTATSDNSNISVTPADDSSPRSDVDVRLARMKRRRKTNQALAATSGVIAGMIVMGPFGAALLGFAAHSVTKWAGRAAESRVRSRHFLNQQRGVVATPINEAAVSATSRQTSTQHDYRRSDYTRQ
uniref:Uncharacterized protein n=1 Tax=Cyclophora tenuis TaxID=216820 RepID=A0A7S1GLN3_CYCTE|mmetsp:Transcript_20792/g.35445  ORF Transcript_20792/g.35445 Transcript_20792/m.35445 type:complete len:220 (+) Transcript_20792:29-688(+)